MGRAATPRALLVRGSGQGAPVVSLQRAQPKGDAEVDVSSLTYFCTARKDGAEGTCKMRQLPAEADSIRRWLAKLHLGDDFEYKGEGLPGITQRVFCALL